MTKLFFFSIREQLMAFEKRAADAFLQHDVVYKTSISSEFIFNGKATYRVHAEVYWTIGRRRIAFYMHGHSRGRTECHVSLAVFT